MGFTAGLLCYLIIIGCGVVSYYVGAAIGGRTSIWMGWTGGLITMAVLIGMTGPSTDALNTIKCRGDSDYQDCIDGD